MTADALLLAAAAMATALGSLIASLALGVKHLAEARATRAAAEQAARQVSPNHGSSVADAVKRIEQRQREHSQSIGGIRDDMRQDREHLLTHLDDSRETKTEINHRLRRLEAAIGPLRPNTHQLKGHS